VRQQVSGRGASARTSRNEIAVQHTIKAFAPVVLAWAAHTGADLAKTNVNGGAIAIGHPLGASGARIMTTLVNALEQRGGRYGLQTMCEGGGMANATIIERRG
jgi:acetyl-CoA acyltransferase